MTGLLSLSALQIDLYWICAKATEDEPITVLLFDLNGFKSYNDTCGTPPAESCLSTQLGGRLRAVIGDDGFAYRVGGDEFSGSPRSGRKEHRKSDAGKRPIALTSRKNGVDVSASWGSVTIPPKPTARSRRCSCPTCGCTRRRSRGPPPATPPEPVAPVARAGELDRKPGAGPPIRPGAQRHHQLCRSCARPRHGPPPGPRRGRRASPPRRALPSAHGPAAAPAAWRSRRRRSPPAGSPRSGPGAVLGSDLAPAIPAEDRGAVEQGDLLHLALGASAEEHLGSGPHRIKRRRRAGVQRPAGDSLGELGLDLLVDRLEELALAAEVVVERAPGDTGGTDDLLGADAGESDARRRAAGRRRPGRRGWPPSAPPGFGAREQATPSRPLFTFLTFIQCVCSLPRIEDETAFSRRIQ